MSIKRDSAALRLTPKGRGYTLAVVHRGRRGTQSVVRQHDVKPDEASLTEAVLQVLGEATTKLRLPEEVYAEWQLTTSTE